MGIRGFESHTRYQRAQVRRGAFMFDSGSSNFDPISPDVQQAAQSELQRRQSLDAADKSKGADALPTGTSIIGAILGGVLGGVPGAMAGQKVGKAAGQVVTGQLAALPGMDHMQAALSAYQAQTDPALGANKAQTDPAPVTPAAIPTGAPSPLGADDKLPAWLETMDFSNLSGI